MVYAFGVALFVGAGELVLQRAGAAFIDVADNPANSFGTDTLNPPSGLSAVANSGDIDLSWTATPDLWADGYEIWRSTTTGCCYTLQGTVVGQSSTTFTDVGANTSGMPAFETTTTGSATASSIVIGKPAGTVDGDLLIAVVAGEDDGGILSAPLGWTQIFQTVNASNFVGAAWYRVASGEPATFTFNSTVSNAMNGAILRYSDADPTDPIDVSLATTSFGNPTSPSVNTTVSNAVVLRVGMLEDAGVADIDYPVGTTGRVEVDVGSGQVTSVADQFQAVAGPTGTAAFTGSSDDYIAATIAIAPASPPTYYYITRASHQSWKSVDSNEDSCC